MAAPTLPYAKDVNGQAILATPVLPLDAAGNPLPAGGGGPVTVADGANVAQGAKADVAWSGTGAGSVIAILKAIWTALTGTLAVALSRYGATARPAASFTRPANTTAYASGQLVANSTVAGSVVPLSIAMSRVAGAGGMLRRIRLRKSGNAILNASFRAHFYISSPTASNGDGGAWLTDNVINYVGACDVLVDKAFTDGAAGNGVPNTGSEINFTSDTYYVLIEARAAYTPVSGETFTLDLELVQN